MATKEPFAGVELPLTSDALGREQMRKSSSWIWIVAGWFFLVRVSDYYTLQNDLGHALTWAEGLRYILIELGFWTAMTPLIAWCAERFPLDRPNLAGNVTILLLLNVVIVFAHSSYRVQLNHLVYPDLPIRPFWRVVQMYVIANSFIIAWFFWAVIGVNHAVKSARRSREREKELIKAQLEALKGQLQPHFLFNTLNSISWLMREDVEAADNMMTSLGELLRATLSIPATEEVTLRQELEVLELYLAIERARFQDRLKVVINADSDTLDCTVPCLLLQPLVENAVRHGVGRLDGRGSVELRATRVGTELSLLILDDGSGISTESSWREGIGLSNTRARLEKHYGEFQSFHYSNRDEGGLIVEIRIPLRFSKVQDSGKESGLRETSHVNCG